jgi:hypothetical protein
MRKPLLLAATLALLVAAPAGASAGGSQDAGARAAAAKVRLTAFRSCGGLVRYARRHSRNVSGPYSGPPSRAPQPSPAPEGGGPGGGQQPVADQPVGGPQEDSSRTNVQEAGVDEPDIVKTDGSRIFAIAGGKLHAVDARSDPPRLLGSLALPGYGQELLLRGDRALVISGTGSPQPVPESAPVAGRVASVPVYAPQRTLVAEIDVSDPAAMRVARTQEVDGSYVSARLNDATARIVVSSPPRALTEASPRLERRVSGWVPASRFRSRLSGRRSTRRVAACRAVRRPARFSGLDLLTVLTIDMSRGLPAVDSDALMTGAEIVYASTGSLYVATPRYFPDAPEGPPPRTTTALHRFDISEAGQTAYRASGAVPGYLLNQWSLSEHRGFLRVASTDSPVWWEGEARRESESFVTVLEDRSGLLVEVGRVGGLGRGERIYAVRFIEDVGYVVTFRQTDPLYTVGLSDPTAPRVLGELRIQGYSAYLHPVGDDLLLGIGQDATEQGRTLGTQLSLFDVSDPAAPVRLHQRTIGSSSSSEVEYDHHAFLWWAPAKLAVLPVELYESRSPDSRPFVGAIGFRVDRAAGIEETGRAAHELGDFPPPIRRALVVGDRLFTLSERGVEAGDLATLAERAFVPFP